jgi:hypothetical protein
MKRVNGVHALGVLVLAGNLAVQAAEPAFVPTMVALAQETPVQAPAPPPAAAPDDAPVREKDMPRPHRVDHAQCLSLAFDGRRPLTGDYEAFFGGRIFAEFLAARHHSFGMTAGAGTLLLDSGSVPDRGAHDTLMLDLGFFYRFYFTAPNTFLRPYGVLHLNVGAMSWDYRDDPIADGERYSRDGVGYYDAAVGMGLMVNVSESFHVFGEMSYGGTSFLDTTYNDFKNDLFDDFGYVTVKAGIGATF